MQIFRFQFSVSTRPLPCTIPHLILQKANFLCNQEMMRRATERFQKEPQQATTTTREDCEKDLKNHNTPHPGYEKSARRTTRRISRRTAKCHIGDTRRLRKGLRVEARGGLRGEARGGLRGGVREEPQNATTGTREEAGEEARTVRMKSPRPIAGHIRGTGRLRDGM